MYRPERSPSNPNVLSQVPLLKHVILCLFLCDYVITLIVFYKQGKNLFQPRLCLILNNRPYCYKTIDLFTAGKLVGKNVQLTFGENINSGMLQKLYWIYIFWNLKPISYILK